MNNIKNYISIDVDYLGSLMFQINDILCNGDQCYQSTCPVNTLTYIISKHMDNGPMFMLFGDYLILSRLRNALYNKS